MSLSPPHAAELVARVGRALYGEEWAAPLARQFDLNERTMRRIRAAAQAGEPYPVAPGLLADLKAFLRGHGQTLLDLAREL